MKIVDVAASTRERLVKEATLIKLAPPGCRMNKDKGMDLSRLWLNAILAMRALEIEKRGLRPSSYTNNRAMSMSTKHSTPSHQTTDADAREAPA